jgi:hypothetical protein
MNGTTRRMTNANSVRSQRRKPIDTGHAKWHEHANLEVKIDVARHEELGLHDLTQRLEGGNPNPGSKHAVLNQY